MELKEIHLKNFRNYKEIIMKFEKGINILIGDNAHGKTNLLESIYFLIITKSFRNVKDEFIIKNNEVQSEIRGVIKQKQKDISDELKIVISDKGKLITLNKKEISKISDYISKFNVVAFSAYDLNLVNGSPSLRRRFLNIELSQLSKQYIEIYKKYNRLLKTRNEYLKMITPYAYDKEYLDILDYKLIEKAILIMKQRYFFIKEVNEKIAVIYIKIFGKDEIKIKYKSTISVDSYTENVIQKGLKSKFKQNRERDIILKQTTIGPHRDDFSFHINNNEVKEYASQGQQRVIILCLKLALVELIKQQKGEWPLLLLDDIFSELDINTRNKVIGYIKIIEQTIITTTDIDNISAININTDAVFKVQDGVIIRKEDEQNE